LQTRVVFQKHFLKRSSYSYFSTGATTIRFLDYIKKNNIPNCHVTVCDVNEDMLKVGKRNTVNYDQDLITWTVGDGQNLHFDDETFKAYTVSFGLRCCSNIDKMLNEAYRILQPSGKFFCLEFSTPDTKMARWFFGLHRSHYMPTVGYLLAQRDLLKYLVEGIERFPEQVSFTTNKKIIVNLREK
jgi:ubiquinone/menaquinone biosynthesis methyltransferase